MTLKKVVFMTKFIKIFAAAAIFSAGAAFGQEDDDVIPVMSLFTNKYVKEAVEVKSKSASEFDPSKTAVKEELQKLNDALTAIQPNHEKFFRYYAKDAQRLQDSVLYSFVGDVSFKTKSYVKTASKPFLTDVKNGVKKFMKTYKPKDVEDMTDAGMKIFADTMKAVASRHENFLEKFPEYYIAAYSINRYAVMQELLLNLCKGVDRSAAKYKRDLWLQYAKTLQRARDNMWAVLFFGADDNGIKSLNFFLDPTLGNRLDDMVTKNVGFTKVAANDLIRTCEKEVYQKYKAAIKEFVAQYTDIKSKEAPPAPVVPDDDVSASVSQESEDAQEEPTFGGGESVNVEENAADAADEAGEKNE